jgi:hypothetical protein
MLTGVCDRGARPKLFSKKRTGVDQARAAQRCSRKRPVRICAPPPHRSSGGSHKHGGRSVAAAGDVNGDGSDDVLVGAPDAGHNGRADSGSVYVVYGRESADPPDVHLARLGARGLRIDGAAAEDDTGSAVAAAGDQNGDGRDEVIVGAPALSGNRSGSAYIVYGSRRRAR